MSRQVQCNDCGNQAVISYVRIPAGDRDSDGNILAPADWLHVIECPQCGTREQRGEAAQPVASDSVLAFDEWPKRRGQDRQDYQVACRPGIFRPKRRAR